MVEDALVDLALIIIGLVTRSLHRLAIDRLLQFCVLVQRATAHVRLNLVVREDRSGDLRRGAGRQKACILWVGFE